MTFLVAGLGAPFAGMTVAIALAFSFPEVPMGYMLGVPVAGLLAWAYERTGGAPWSRQLVAALVACAVTLAVLAVLLFLLIVAVGSAMENFD